MSALRSCARRAGRQRSQNPVATASESFAGDAPNMTQVPKARSQIESPLVGKNIFSTHGRGIYLINQLMDSVHFERGGTEIHMRKS